MQKTSCWESHNKSHPSDFCVHIRKNSGEFILHVVVHVVRTFSFDLFYLSVFFFISSFNTIGTSVPHILLLRTTIFNFQPCDDIFYLASRDKNSLNFTVTWFKISNTEYRYIHKFTYTYNQNYLEYKSVLQRHSTSTHVCKTLCPDCSQVQMWKLWPWH